MDSFLAKTVLALLVSGSSANDAEMINMDRPFLRPTERISYEKPEVRILPLPIPIGLLIPTGEFGGFSPDAPIEFPRDMTPKFFSKFRKARAAGDAVNNRAGDVLDGFGDPIRAAMISSQANTYLQLAVAPYLKQACDTNGRDLPTVQDVRNLIQTSSYELGFQPGL